MVWRSLYKVVIRYYAECDDKTWTSYNIVCLKFLDCYCPLPEALCAILCVSWSCVLTEYYDFYLTKIYPLASAILKNYCYEFFLCILTKSFQIVSMIYLIFHMCISKAFLYFFFLSSSLFKYFHQSNSFSSRKSPYYIYFHGI